MKQVILVTGIGRSGTSLICKVLHELGYIFRTSTHAPRVRFFADMHGYFENRVLKNVVRIWNYVEGSNVKFKQLDRIPLANVYRGKSPIKYLLLLYADFLLSRELFLHKTCDRFAFKSPIALWWVWRIALRLKKLSLPAPKIIFCDRNSTAIATSRFLMHGVPFRHSVEYSHLCREQFNFLKHYAGKVHSGALRVEFEKFYNDPDLLATELSSFLDCDKQRVRNAISKAFNQEYVNNKS